MGKYLYVITWVDKDRPRRQRILTVYTTKGEAKKAFDNVQLAPPGAIKMQLRRYKLDPWAKDPLPWKKKRPMTLRQRAQKVERDEDAQVLREMVLHIEQRRQPDKDLWGQRA